MSAVGALLERRFRLSERNATVRGEVLGGVTTFMTMAYIVFVNAQILGAAGMPSDGVMVATCLGAAFATVMMGLLANLPVALAPGMGMNALVAFGICKGMGFPWQTALGMVFWSGVLFVALSLVKFRETVISAIPQNLKYAAAAGIGLFIAFIGLEHAGVVVKGDPLLRLGDLTARPTLVALFGLAATAILMAFEVKGAVLIGLAATAAVALASGVLLWSQPEVKEFEWTSTMLRLDFVRSLVPAAWPAILTLLFFDLFDTVGTLIGVSEEAGFLDREGRVPNAGRALLSDATGTVVGALLGTSTVTSYIESASGVAAGARTGLSNMVVGALFVLSLAALPVVQSLAQAPAVTAPALIVVGYLMTAPLRKIDWRDPTEGLPAFLTMLVMPLTFSISAGLAAGFVSYSIIKLAKGRGREVHPLVHVIAAVIAAGYVLTHVAAK